MTSCSNALPLFSFVQTALIPVKDLALQWSFYNFLEPCRVGIWVIPFMSGQEEGEEQLSGGIRKSSKHSWPSIALKYRVTWFFLLGAECWQVASVEKPEHVSMLSLPADVTKRQCCL